MCGFKCPMKLHTHTHTNRHTVKKSPYFRRRRRRNISVVKEKKTLKQPSTDNTVNNR